jgi:hypothetical protein
MPAMDAFTADLYWVEWMGNEAVGRCMARG